MDNLVGASSITRVWVPQLRRRHVSISSKIEDLTVKFDTDVMSDKSITLAFDKKKADDRKTWLLESTAKDPKELEVPYGNVKQLNITDFVHKDLVNFSLADLKRSIAHVCRWTQTFPAKGDVFMFSKESDC